MNNYLTVENIDRILDLTMSQSTTRKDIANLLNISLNNSGKLVQALLDHKILKEYSKSDNSPGRNAGVLIPAKAPIFAVSHIFHDHISTDFFGYDLKISEHTEHYIDDPLFIDDEFTRYFITLSHSRSSLSSIILVSDGRPCGDSFVGSTIPGVNGLELKAIAEEHLPHVSVSLENRYAFSLSDFSELDAVITDEYDIPRCYFLNNGQLIGGKNAFSGISDHFSLSHTRKASDSIKYAKNFHEYTKLMTSLFSSVINLISPERIFFKSGRYSRSDEILLSIREALSVDYAYPSTSLPILLCEGDVFDLTLPSLRHKIRSYHINNLLDSLS